ncbi:MAG: hypothetical protein ACI4UA_02600 [Bacteroidaceae bacterium]
MKSWLHRINHFTTVKLYPGHEDMLQFMYSLPQAFARGEGTLIHDGRNQLRILEYEGREYVVKSYQVPIFFNRLVYGLLRSSKAERALLKADHLIEIGIGSPLPVGFINIRSGLLFTHSYMVTVRSSCPYRYDMLLTHSFDCLEQVCREVGRCTAIMHEHGMYNMDYSRGNILFDVEPRPLEKDGRYVDVTQENVQVRLEMVDLNRIRSCQVDILKGCRNFNRLPASGKMHWWMAEEYARVRGFSAEECFYMMRWYRLRQSDVYDWER